MQKQKAPGYYKTKPSELERALLTVIPEAPRVPSKTFPSGWDWGILSGAALLQGLSSKRGSQVFGPTTEKNNVKVNLS